MFPRYHKTSLLGHEEGLGAGRMEDRDLSARPEGRPAR